MNPTLVLGRTNIFFFFVSLGLFRRIEFIEVFMHSAKAIAPTSNYAYVINPYVNIYIYICECVFLRLGDSAQTDRKRLSKLFIYVANKHGGNYM